MPSNNGHSKGRLFSRFVGRVAGLSASSLEGLRATRTLSEHAASKRLGRELDELGERLPAALHEAIKGLEDRDLRRDLLRLKRDVHNRRRLRGERLARIADHLDPDLSGELSRYREIWAHERALAAELRDVFDRELTEIRMRFQDLVQQEDFEKGLLLSSPTLAGELSRYVGAPADRPGSKVRQIERSLMRYYSRTAMKTTPFGTFCALVPGVFTGASGNGTSASCGDPFRGDPFRKRALVRINKALYARIVAHLFERPATRRHLDVELNPTLRPEGTDRWVFLSAEKGREVFQRLARNPALEELCRQLALEPSSLAALIALLVEHPRIEAEEAEASAYLDRLIDVGFLRFRMGIREQEVEWDRPLVEILEAIDDEHATVLACLLGILRGGLEAYSDAPPAQRREILEVAADELKSTEERLEVELLPQHQPIFYEDASGEAELRLDPEDLEAVLGEYLELVRRLAWPRVEQAGMRHFFETHYGPEGRPVPLLSFYEDYYREHFKDHLDRQRKRRSDTAPEESADERGEADDYDLGNPFSLELVGAIHEADKALTERLRELWRAAPEAEEIRLERQDLEAVLAEVPEEGETCFSASLFAQWVPQLGPDGKPALVANNSFTGYGKYFSRFLDLLPDEVRLDLVDNNRRHTGRELAGRELAEICGDAGFNGNLHPPLLPLEISYPTGESGEAEEQISSPDLVVARDCRDPHRLCLRQAATEREIIPVDLGFLNPGMRPPLYQLLSRFTPPANFGVKLPESPRAPESISTGPGGASAANFRGIRHRPRITYRGRLILARRQWQISLVDFPRKGRKESAADYFLRIADWRVDLGLPDEVFLRVQPIFEPTSEAPAVPSPDDPRTTATDEQDAPVKPRLRAHLYKPQYIDFKDPLLVDLFSRAPENLRQAIFTFEERLPRADQLISSVNGDCVTELVVQVDLPAQRQEGIHG